MLVAQRNNPHLSSRAFYLLSVCCLLQSVVAGAQTLPLNLMPVPASVEQDVGSLPIDPAISVSLIGYTEPRLDRAVQRFRAQLSRQTGIPLSGKSVHKSEVSRVSFAIHTEHSSLPVQQVGEDESYTLEVTTTQAKLSAPTPLGTMHGLQTLLQLVTPSSNGFVIPAVSIRDNPRFPWRGLMIDVSRHFIPLNVIERNLDGMERVKMNVFHWHLSDNQGFRVESSKFPKLQQMGSDGLFYTQAEVRDLIEYARDRGIRVVPEFDLPGHSTAWFVGYPELASGPGPYEIERRWGIFDPAMDPTNEKNYKFLNQFVGEMAKLFPDQFFHVGGDEVNGKQWDANAAIQAFKQAHEIKDNAGLQAYFNKRLQAIVAKHGKTMIGWDEVLDPSLPRDITIQSWRGPESLAQAAKEGYRGLLSSGYYLDLGWSAARHYAVDPMDESSNALSSDQKARILGGEACMWSEYVDVENIDSRIWPRNAAIAERLWSPKETRDPASMYPRLEAISQELEWLGLTHKTYYRQMLQRIAGPASTEEFAALRTVADVVEPVKDYTRASTVTVEATSETPLNRLVDAVPLESDRSRNFEDRVTKYIQSRCNDKATEGTLRSQLATWRENDAKFQTLSQKSFLANEAAATSKDLSAVANVGLEAIDYLAKGLAAPPDWKKEKLLIIQTAEAPKAQLLLIPAPAIAKMVEAAATGACSSN